MVVEPFLIVALLLTLPLPASAGVFSYVSSLFFSSVETSNSLSANPLNSQTIPLLRAALNIDPNPSKGGGGIVVVDGTSLLPEAGPSGTLIDIEGEEASSDQISVYVVREGDTLSQIAGMFNVSINTIRWANNVSSSQSIQPGQTLIILPVSGVRHTVAKDDTLKSITKKYSGDLDEILSYNDLSLNVVLAVGDVVVVPNGEIPAPKGTTSTTSIRPSSGPSYSGYYIKPVSGVRTQGLHGYNAVDIGAPSGTPIVASASGKVIISRSTGWNGGYGVYLVIRHDNGTQTLYSHNSRNIVYAGDTVVQGQVIGYVGSTGRSTGSHVHFEVRGAQNPF